MCKLTTSTMGILCSDSGADCKLKMLLNKHLRNSCHSKYLYFKGSFATKCFSSSPFFHRAIWSVCKPCAGEQAKWPKKGVMKFVVKAGLEPVPEMSNTTTFAHSSCAASMVYRSKGMHCQEFTFCGGYLMPVFLQLLETLVHRIYILTRAKGKAQQKSGRPVRE